MLQAGILPIFLLFGAILSIICDRNVDAVKVIPYAYPKLHNVDAANMIPVAYPKLHNVDAANMIPVAAQLIPYGYPKLYNVDAAQVIPVAYPKLQDENAAQQFAANKRMAWGIPPMLEDDDDYGEMKRK